MDANRREWIMNAEDMPLKEEVYQIVGAAMEVLNGVGHGLHEKPCENGLAVESRLRGIGYEQQRRFPVTYKTVLISEYVPDLIAFGSVIVDTKVIDRITDPERGQMLNYLRIAQLQVGVVLNFKRAKLEWERVVLSDHSR
jgi:GxxExxY protein